MMPGVDVWPADPSACPTCGRDSCEDHLAPANPDTPSGLDPAFLADAVDVIREGRRIADEGIRYTVDGLVPAYGTLGMLVAYTKVGKTTLGHTLAASVAMGRPFLDRDTTRARVLAIAAEDPPEYTAYLARTLDVEPTRLTFYRAPVRLTVDGLNAIRQTVTAGGYGLVLIASWQAVIRGLVRDENDNAGAVNIVETVKAATRTTGIPWLIDAHSGKGEDQDDDADPSRAMRGASGAAGAADYTLSLRYANGAFGTQRRLSGKGRFVNLAPLTLDYNPDTGLYTCLGCTKHAATETTWRLICEMGALDTTPRSVTEIARRTGLIPDEARLGGAHRKQIASALLNRPEVGRVDETRRGQKTTLYRRLEVA
jgi:AAA domain